MKTCIHLSQAAAVALTPDDRALISIRDTNAGTPPLQPGWQDILFLQFDDVSEHAEFITRRAGGNPPNRTHCEAIVEFAKTHHDRSIIVHCWAGVSRSAATCLALEAMGWHLPDRHRACYANTIMLREFNAILNPNPAIKRPIGLLWDTPL